MFLQIWRGGAPCTRELPNDTHLETVCCEMDMLEFLLSGVYEKAASPHSPYWNLLIEGFLSFSPSLSQSDSVIFRQ